MIRWGLTIVGVGMLILAVVQRVSFPPISTTPEVVTTERAVEYLQDYGQYRYLSIQSAPDLDRRIYEAVSVRPANAARPTDKVYSPLGPGDGFPADLESYLGTLVRVNRRSTGHKVSLGMVEDKKAGKEEMVQERILTPIEGSDYRLWVISPSFDGGDPGGWHRYSSFEGVLTRFRDLKENVRRPDVEHSYKELVQFIEKEFGIAVPEDAYLLVCDVDWDHKPYYYCPLKGSQNQIFYMMSDAILNKVQSQSLLTGIFKPWNSAVYGDFGKILGIDMPKTIGILDQRNGEDYNRDRSVDFSNMVVMGSFFTLLGIIGIIRHRFKMKKLAKQRIQSPLHNPQHLERNVDDQT
ncbi:MAG: hypothetical protein JW937_06610 [Candidatus Omnitrophica bacterium]|nr:hypothetical protein [Candidatus Omnitrophota bacterium]